MSDELFGVVFVIGFSIIMSIFMGILHIFKIIDLNAPISEEGRKEYYRKKENDS